MDLYAAYLSTAIFHSGSGLCIPLSRACPNALDLASQEDRENLCSTYHNWHRSPTRMKPSSTSSAFASRDSCRQLVTVHVTRIGQPGRPELLSTISTAALNNLLHCTSPLHPLQQRTLPDHRTLEHGLHSSKSGFIARRLRRPQKPRCLCPSNSHTPGRPPTPAAGAKRLCY